MRSRLAPLARILCALALFAGFASTAFAAAEPAEPVQDFWQALVRCIVTFKADDLMALLGKPEFAIPAFLAVDLIAAATRALSERWSWSRAS